MAKSGTFEGVERSSRVVQEPYTSSESGALLYGGESSIVSDHGGRWHIEMVPIHGNPFTVELVVSGALTDYKELRMKLDEYQALEVISKLARAVVGE